MLMVDTIYRTNRALLLLVRNSARLLFNDNIKNTIYYSKCVTTHTDSQAVATLFSLVPSALKLSSYAQASFIGISSDSNIRESLIYYVRLQNIENNNKVFYIPHKHRKISSIILDKIGINYNYSDEYTKEPFTKEIIEDFNKSKEYATFVVNEIGEDIFIKLKKLNKQALRNGCKTATCEISIEQPLVKEFDSKMMDLGYMFCGLEPTSNLQWRAIYTNLFYQDFNIEDVKLHDKLALDLREYIINLYETIKNK